jgi:hypothetical protein
VPLAWTSQGPERSARAHFDTPLRLTLAVPELNDDARVELLFTGSDGYALELSRDALELKLWRTQDGAGRLLGSWRLPHDAGTAERFVLAVEPRPEDGGVAELTLWDARGVLGVAIDPEPLTHGEGVRIPHAPRGAELTLHARSP